MGGGENGGENSLSLRHFFPVRHFSPYFLYSPVFLIILTRRLLRRSSACQTKMDTKPGRAVTGEFIGGGVHSLISVLPI